MGKKKKIKKKNPKLQEKYNEGFMMGYERARLDTLEFFRMRFDKLQEQKGIGEKTLEKIVNTLGNEYFQRIKK